MIFPEIPCRMTLGNLWLALPNVSHTRFRTGEPPAYGQGKMSVRRAAVDKPAGNWTAQRLSLPST
jgi:hypothetical protein